MQRKTNEIKDRPVPPVKGAITQMQDIVQRPAGHFGVVQGDDTMNPLVLDDTL